MPYFGENHSHIEYRLDQPGNPGLREAQLAAAHALSAHFFRRTEPAIVVMPTGSGKTGVMVLASFILRARRVLALTPSRIVREQLGEAFATLKLLRTLSLVDTSLPSPKVRILSERPSDAAAWSALADYDVVVTTVQSSSPLLQGVAAPPPDLFDLILCDEAHHEPAPTWRALLDHYPSSRKALFTATPFRRDQKAVRGKLVFDYPLSRAREDKVFGRLEYLPIEPLLGVSADLALARAAAEQIAARRASGGRDLLMVRTAQKKRATQLADLYARETPLRLKTIMGHHSQRYVKGVLAAMRAGELDGAICVDMLGEGFDLPEMKVAVLHSPHRSLAVTLQFIGRFARTSGANLGHACFLAVPQEIESDARELYKPGAEWNEIVEELSQRKLEAEHRSREVFESFHEPAPQPHVFRTDEAERLDISHIAPYFHVKVYDSPQAPNLDAAIEPPTGGEFLLLRRSVEQQALVCVTREVIPCRWAREDVLADVQHELFVLFYDETARLLFICSSRREIGVYDSIIEAIAAPTARRLSPEELNRVLRDVKNTSFFSVGMRNRAAFGYGEAYRIMAGKSADRAVQKEHGRFYDRGHCFGKGEEAGQSITVGFSSASKVWANKWGTVADLFDWCRRLGSKLADTRTVSTGSGLDYLPLGRRASQFPKRIIAVDWNEEVYKRQGLHLWTGLAEPVPLLDLSLRLQSAGVDEITCVVEGPSVALSLQYRLDRQRWFSLLSHPDAQCGDAEGRRLLPFLDFLHEYPPAFYGADLSRLEGDALSTPPPNPDDVFDVAAIEEVAWALEKVDPLLEKPGSGSGRSLFEWLEERLAAGKEEVVFNDDGPGEVADFITLGQGPVLSTVATFYHCKAAHSKPIPGNRVDDLYDVAGQAVKSVRFTDPNLLRAHLSRRVRTTVEGLRRITKGTQEQINALLAEGVVLAVRVVVVQPGVGRNLSGSMSALLAAANAYMISSQSEPLRVVGSARP